MARYLFLAVLLLGSRAWADSRWTSAEKTLGRPGEAQGEGFQISFPRTDLNVVVQGYPLDSANVLASRFTFNPSPAGASKKERLEGRVYLLDSEVAAAMAQAANGSLEITALYSPFLDESPCLKCLRLRGEGPQSALAWAAKMVLSATGTPLTLSPTPTVDASTPAASPNNWGNVQDLLGPGEEKGKTLLYRLEGKDREASLAFQAHGKETTVMGEFGLPEGESKVLVEEFLKRHITVSALFYGNKDEAKAGFAEFWAVGDRKKLAEELKEILGQEGFLNP